MQKSASQAGASHDFVCTFPLLTWAAIAGRATPVAEAGRRRLIGASDKLLQLQKTRAEGNLDGAKTVRSSAEQCSTKQHKAAQSSTEQKKPEQEQRSGNLFTITNLAAKIDRMEKYADRWKRKRRKRHREKKSSVRAGSAFHCRGGRTRINQERSGEIRRDQKKAEEKQKNIWTR